MPNWPFLHNGNPIHIARAEGVFLYTKDGRQILDGAGGAIVCNIGHGRAEVADVIREATLKADYILPPWSCDEREELVELLTSKWLPPPFTRVHLTCGGSEAIESAMRIAVMHFAAQGKENKVKIIGRDVSYHGTTLATISVGGHESRKVGIKHMLQRYPVAPTPYTLRCESSNPTQYYLDELEKTILSEDPNTVAALLAEPIAGASGGAMVPPDGYWEGVREMCNKYNMILIVDEIMTGFGRTGTRFGYQHWPIEPDIFVSGKGLTAGYSPLNGLFSTDRIAEPIEQSAGYSVMFHTYGSFAPACAAATKVLQIMDREALVDRAKSLGEVLRAKLQAAFSNHPHVAECRGKGLLQAIEIVKNRASLERYPASENVTGRVIQKSFENGVHFYGAGNSIVRDVVLLGPPMTVDESHLDRMVNALSDAVDSVTRA